MAIMEVGEGRYAILQNDGQGVNNWHSEAMIPCLLLHYNIMGIVGGGTYSGSRSQYTQEWFCGAKHGITIIQLYAAFPPSLYAPTI
jgi:hypothetical protein